MAAAGVGATAGKVSILIPVYNRPGLVCQAIDSALAQTYPDKEVIVVDDCSTDGTAAALERYAGRITVVKRGENGGIGAALNTGLAASTGQWIKRCDSDDVLYPNAVRDLLDAHAGLALGEKTVPFMSIGTPGGRTYTYQPGPLINRLDSFAQAVLVLDGFGIHHGTCIFPRSIFDRMSYNPRYRYGEDWDLDLQLVLAGYRLLHIETPVYGLREHGDQLTLLSSSPHANAEAHRLSVRREFSLMDAGRRRRLRGALARYQRRKGYLRGKWVAANPSMIPGRPHHVRGGRAGEFLGRIVRSHPLAWAARHSVNQRSPWHLAGAAAWYAGRRGEEWEGRGLRGLHWDFVHFGMSFDDALPAHAGGRGTRRDRPAPEVD